MAINHVIGLAHPKACGWCHDFSKELTEKCNCLEIVSFCSQRCLQEHQTSKHTFRCFQCQSHNVTADWVRRCIEHHDVLFFCNQACQEGFFRKEKNSLPTQPEKHSPLPQTFRGSLSELESSLSSSAAVAQQSPKGSVNIPPGEMFEAIKACYSIPPPSSSIFQQTNSTLFSATSRAIGVQVSCSEARVTSAAIASESARARFPVASAATASDNARARSPVASASLASTSFRALNSAIVAAGAPARAHALAPVTAAAAAAAASVRAPASVLSSASSPSLQVLISSVEIAQKIKEVAHRIKRDYPNEEITLVMIMKGAIHVTSDLLRELGTLEVPARLEFIQASSYGMNGAHRGELTVKLDMLKLPSIQHNNVIIIDDIFDSGKTMTTVKMEIEKLRPKSVKTMVLLLKKVPRETSYRPDYSLFEIENKFVVGYGLDYKEFYRGLKDICFFSKEPE